jgi:hypothetical protein
MPRPRKRQISVQKMSRARPVARRLRTEHAAFTLQFGILDTRKIPAPDAAAATALPDTFSISRRRDFP